MGGEIFEHGAMPNDFCLETHLRVLVFELASALIDTLELLVPPGPLTASVAVYVPVLE